MTSSTRAAGPAYRPRHSGVPVGPDERGRTRRRWRWALAALLLAGVVGTGLTCWLQGYRIYVVHTGSMVPTYNPGDLVLDRRPAGHYRRGEVITFRHSDLTTDVVTHRITGVTATGLIHTKGDANATADVWDIRPDQVRGAAVARLPRLGYLVVFLRQPAGLASIATAVLAIVLLWRLFFPVPADEVASARRRRVSPVWS
jgi:signal peptidase